MTAKRFTVAERGPSRVTEPREESGMLNEIRKALEHLIFTFERIDRRVDWICQRIKDNQPQSRLVRLAERFMAECIVSDEATWERENDEAMTWAEKEVEDAFARARAFMEKEEQLERSPLTRAQLQLANSMVDFSQKCFQAYWKTDIERLLWKIVDENSPTQLGNVEITRNDIGVLKRLSEECDGWIRWEPNVGPVFVPMKEWLRSMSSHEHTQTIA